MLLGVGYEIKIAVPRVLPTACQSAATRARPRQARAFVPDLFVFTVALVLLEHARVA